MMEKLLTGNLITDENLLKSVFSPKAELQLTEKPITVLPLAVNRILNNTKYK